ncbi:aminotransferase class I/II-fold pyridoxal phosphate-dependent enzyme [uncultured Ezakiella sp.]|uniref:aminotransferase class I/II-fold pyridoxal phosphate-dependent enzyme n=1 Tax=uncultured Ezakiella sp. TaxID=1637529 RepID=UPI0025FD2A6A|nr:aminotransferase class I/II-fold pyridoxal phosphate-dependent enzyme [uncultured Ezakiella sp.]
MKRELYESLRANLKRDSVKFLMPGHKHRLDQVISLDPSFDFTESFGTDNLNDPQDVIKRSQMRCANIFGSKASFYTVNGSSGGLIASIFYATSPGDDILVARNCHISVIRACIINRLKVHYIQTNFDQGLDKNILAEEFEDQVKKIQPKAIVITHPNYFGFPVDIEKIVDISKNYQSTLIVDEAHGGHLHFSDDLPMSAVDAGADIVIQSVHKMLTGLNQSAYVHVASDRVDIDRLFRAITTFQTTSPSYPIIASCEAAAAFMQVEGRRRLTENIAWAKKFTDDLKQIEKLRVLDYNNRDPLKIVFNVRGMDGESLHKKLYEDYNIEAEMNDGVNVLLLATLMNEEEDYAKALAAVKDLARDAGGEFRSKENYFIIPKKIMEPYQAYACKRIEIDARQAAGRVSADFIGPYPPGIPVLVPGEQVEDGLLKYIDKKIYVIDERS